MTQKLADLTSASTADKAAGDKEIADMKKQLSDLQVWYWLFYLVTHKSRATHTKVSICNTYFPLSLSLPSPSVTLFQQTSTAKQIADLEAQGVKNTTEIADLHGQITKLESDVVRTKSIYTFGLPFALYFVVHQSLLCFVMMILSMCWWTMNPPLYLSFISPFWLLSYTSIVIAFFLWCIVLYCTVWYCDVLFCDGMYRKKECRKYKSGQSVSERNQVPLTLPQLKPESILI